MKFTKHLILILLFPFSVFCQEFSLSGTVIDAQKTPISYANVILLTTQDSIVVTGASTDEKGLFSLSSLKKNKYTIKISFIGYKDFFKEIMLENDLVIGEIVLEEYIENLGEVSILAKTPTLKKEADKLVFNVENTALIEGNMLQVLKNTPGVLVLGNSIEVKNISPTVYINDRKVHLTSADLLQLLEGSSANTIKSVEVITNPSARYDADSGAAINIIMDKNLITGYRGAVFTNYTQGVFPRYNGGMNNFFKSDRINFFMNYSYTDSKVNRDNRERVNYFDTNQNIDQVWASRINRNTVSQTHNFNFNFDYVLNKRNTLSISSNMLFLPYFKYNITNRTNVFDSNQNLDLFFDARNLSRDKKNNLGFDLDFVHEFTKGQLALNAHFTTYDYKRDQNVISDYFNEDATSIETTAYSTDNNQDTNIFTAKADYTLPLGESAVLETGLKTSNIWTNSDITQFDIINGQPVLDMGNTDAFDYEEDVLAAYINYSADWEKWNVVAGLRIEQTNIKGVSESVDQPNTQDYLEWFPIISLSFKATEKLDLYTNYKRSINRPNYQSLNPFQFFLNDNTIVVGNPNLQPVFVDHVVVGASLNNRFSLEGYYMTYNNNIFELPRQNNEENFIAYTPTNLDKTTEYGFDLLTYFNVSKSWSVYFVTSFYNIKDEGTFDNNFVSRDQWSNYSILQNDITFLKDKSLNAVLNMYLVSKNIQGFVEVEDRLVSELSISKSLWNKKAIVSLTASDLFNTQDFDTSTRYLNQNNSSFINLDNRYLKFGFRYKFGNTILKTNEQIKEREELKRLKEKEH